MGGGVAFLDWDVDGDPDLLLVNGTSWDDPASGPPQALYANDGAGRFTLAERFGPSSDLRCEVFESGEPWELDSDARIALYRAVQECLANAARHAKAESVEVAVRWTDDELRIVISDDGIGFDGDAHAAASPEVSGFGLFTLRESLGLHGGNVKVDTARGIGTTVTLSMPRQRQESQEEGRA